MYNKDKNKKKQILFVCYLGKQRSPTAKDTFNKLFKQNEDLNQKYFAKHSSFLFDKKKIPSLIKDSYRVIALTKGINYMLKRKFPELSKNEKLKCFNLSVLNRNGSKKLVKKLEDYFYSNTWC